MSWIKTIPYGEADARLKPLYDRVTGPDGNVDNIMMSHSLRPHSMEGHMLLYKNCIHPTEAQDAKGSNGDHQRVTCRLCPRSLCQRHKALADKFHVGCLACSPSPSRLSSRGTQWKLNDAERDPAIARQDGLAGKKDLAITRQDNGRLQAK